MIRFKKCSKFQSGNRKEKRKHKTTENDKNNRKTTIKNQRKP
jgi:hypothetical protein